MKILIVDDNFVNRKLLKVILSNIGDCDFASDGLEALEAVRLSYEEDRPYNLICLDVMMPNMNGLDTMKGIRKYEEELNISLRDGCKIIMVTSLEDDQSIFQAFRNGCESYIIKPIESKKILDSVKKLGLN